MQQQKGPATMVSHFPKSTDSNTKKPWGIKELFKQAKTGIINLMKGEDSTNENTSTAVGSRTMNSIHIIDENKNRPNFNPISSKNPDHMFDLEKLNEFLEDFDKKPDDRIFFGKIYAEPNTKDREVIYGILTTQVELVWNYNLNLVAHEVETEKNINTDEVVDRIVELFQQKKDFKAQSMTARPFLMTDDRVMEMWRKIAEKTDTYIQLYGYVRKLNGLFCFDSLGPVDKINQNIAAPSKRWYATANHRANLLSEQELGKYLENEADYFNENDLDKLYKTVQECKSIINRPLLSADNKQAFIEEFSPIMLSCLKILRTKVANPGVAEDMPKVTQYLAECAAIQQQFNINAGAVSINFGHTANGGK